MTAFSKFAWLKAVEQFDLNATEHKVLMHISNKADGATGLNAYVTNLGIAEAVARSDKSVRRATKRLQELGLIKRTQRGIQGTRPSVYRLAMPLKPDTEVTGHDESNRSLVTGHLRDSDQVTGHPCPSNRSSVTGISDPVTRSRKGSGSYEPDLLPDIEMSGVDASRPVGEGQEQSEPALRADSAIGGEDSREESEPSEDVSSSTEGSREAADVAEPDGSALPDIEPMSGVSDRPATERGEMHDKTDDPWAATATKWEDPFATATAEVSDLYDDEPAEEPRRRLVPETFVMPKNAFIGPPTDLLTGGPDWDKGPQQLPY